jgi:hypothetical protein
MTSPTNPPHDNKAFSSLLGRRAATDRRGVSSLPRRSPYSEGVM